MLRGWINSARVFLRRAPSQTMQGAEAAAQIANASKFELDPVKLEALNAYNDAVRILSKGKEAGFRPRPPANLADWFKVPIERLSRVQLDQVALAYYTGQGVQADHSRAVEYWSKALESGSQDAKFHLSMCKMNGHGVLKDEQAAFKEMKDLADSADHAQALYTVGVMYDRGIGCAVDELQAFRYFCEAIRKGVPPALYNVANALAQGKGVKQDVEEAKAIYEAGMQLGDPSCMFTLGTWHYRGHAGLVPNFAKAYELYMQAAEHKHPHAMYNVGCSLLAGHGTSIDRVAAMHWFEKASDAGVQEATFNLIRLLIEDIDIPKDLERAKKLLEKVPPTHPAAIQLWKEIKQSSRKSVN